MKISPNRFFRIFLRIIPNDILEILEYLIPWENKNYKLYVLTASVLALKSDNNNRIGF